MTTPISTDTNGNQIAGTSGSSIANNSATQLSSSEFLDLMMVELTHQDPTSPDSSDPTQYLSQLAQMTDVEQETNTAQNTSQAASEQAISQAVGLIGDTVSYLNSKSGSTVTGTVNSVQITSSGPTLTVDGVAGVDPSSISNVTAAGGTAAGSGSTDTSGSAGSASGASGSAGGTSDASGSTSGSTDTTDDPTTGA